MFLLPMPTFTCGKRFRHIHNFRPVFLLFVRSTSIVISTPSLCLDNRGLRDWVVLQWRIFRSFSISIPSLFVSLTVQLHHIVNSLEMDSDTLVGAHGKPCISCRKRKIKCDRSRPCSNCTRSKQLCAYESPDNRVDGSSPAMASSDADLRERLAKLEKMMAAMMSSDGGSRSRGEASQAPRQRPGVSPLGTSSTSPSFEENISSSFAAATENSISPVGQILFQEGCSAYHDADFWPGLIPEVGYECFLNPRCFMSLSLF